MTFDRRKGTFAALVTAALAALAVGCSGSTGADTASPATDVTAVGESSLDGVRLDVRRDPG